jgi:hypothetical protein
VSAPDEVISQKFGSPHWSCSACGFTLNVVGSSVCELCRVEDAGWTCGGCLCQNIVATMRCNACKLPNVQAICGAATSLLGYGIMYAATVVQAP